MTHSDVAGTTSWGSGWSQCRHPHPCPGSPAVPGYFGKYLDIWSSRASTDRALHPQALIDILCLDALAIGTWCSWYRINRVAALLLLPYLGWLAMATCLTIRIWRDNVERKSD